MSIKSFLNKYKPGVERKTHLLLAASLWTIVGCSLLTRGVRWLFEADTLYFIIPALVVGTIKALFILDKSAKKSIERILKLADGSCLGAVYSVKTWLLVLFMIMLGFIIRNSSIPGEISGALYVTIGWALIFASRSGWRAVYNYSRYE